jgi:acetyl-CoA carboxylase carboxyl transferase subunit beta
VDDTFLVLGRDNKKDGYSINFDIENQVFGIDNNHYFFSEVEKEFSSYWNSSYWNKGSRSDDSPYDYSMYDYSWNNYINSCIDIYLCSQIGIASFILSGSENYSESYISTYILGESRNSSGNRNSRLRTRVRRALNPKTLPTMKVNMFVTEPSSKRSKG